MLTKTDVGLIRVIVEEELEKKLEQKFEEKLKFLPTKDEFYKAMDKIMGELKTIREEQSAQSYRVGNHENRIVALEEIHNIASAN